MRSRRDGYTQETIAALLRAGRKRFGHEGYEAVGLGDIAADAQVTTGAIYHHFDGKKGLFLAVAEAVEAELLGCAQAVDDPDPWRRFVKAFLALLDACSLRDVQRIVFLDAPRVIGLDAWRELEHRYAFGAMSEALTALLRARVIRPRPVELVAPILLAVLANARERSRPRRLSEGPRGP